MRIQAEELKLILQEFFEKYGVDQYSVAKIAEGMVQADLYGIKTHGSTVFLSHIDRIKRVGYNLNPHFAVKKEANSCAIIDADNVIGFSSASYCMEYAFERAKEQGSCSLMAGR